MTKRITVPQPIIVYKEVIELAAINNYEAKELKEGIIHIHRMLELRKLHIKNSQAGKICGACNSICSELGLQKQTLHFISKR
ncbi:MAG: hypothetical protein QXV09_05435 [Candidatus Bathyarchaeia archaeon]